MGVHNRCYVSIISFLIIPLLNDQRSILNSISCLMDVCQKFMFLWLLLFCSFLNSPRLFIDSLIQSLNACLEIKSTWSSRIFDECNLGRHFISLIGMFTHLKVSPKRTRGTVVFLLGFNLSAHPSIGSQMAPPKKTLLPPGPRVFQPWSGDGSVCFRFTFFCISSFFNIILVFQRF